MAYATELTDALRSVGVRAALKDVLRRLRLMRDVARERRALARLTADELDDIGLSREAAAKEAARPVWDAPDHWRRR